MMVGRLVAMVLVALMGALVVDFASSPAPAGKEQQSVGAGENVALSPSVVQRRGGTLIFDVGFSTRLFGGHEIARDGRANAGDRDANGWATIALVGPRRICYSIIVSDIAKPVGAHIHRAGPGSVGAVVVTLQPPVSGHGSSSGCVSASATIVKAIRARPAGFYVNVHTGQFPGGAVRGQL